MARNITAFRERIEVSVENAQANRALQHTTQQAHKLTSAFTGGMGALSSHAQTGITRVQSLGGAFTSLVGKGTAFLSVVTGITASLTGAGAALFAAVVKASEFGSKIHDMSQQTGLGAETLSSLKFAADQGSGSIEELGTGMKKFSATVAEAARGSEDAAKKLKRLGVDPKEAILDLDKAIGKALLTIAKTPSGVLQVERASDAFGKKLGASLIPTIMSFDGDLAGLIKRAKELGVTLSDVEAEELDAFGDMLDTLKAQGLGFANAFAVGVAPALTEGMGDISTAARANRAEMKAWGRDVGDAIRGARLAAKTELGAMLVDLNKFSIEYLSGAGLIFKFFKWYGQREGDAGGDATVGKGILRKKSAALDLYEDMERDAAKKTRSVKALIDPLQKFRDIYKELNIEIQFYGDKTERARVEQQFMRLDMEKLTGKAREYAEMVKKIALGLANRKDIEKEIAEVAAEQKDRQKEYTASLQQFEASQKSQLSELRGEVRSAIDDYNDWRVSLVTTGYGLETLTEAAFRQRAELIDLERQWQSLFETMGDLDKDAGPFVRPDKWSKARGSINEAAAAAAASSKNWKMEPPREALPKWTEFFRTGLQDALMEINGMFQQQQTKKQGLFGKILGFAAPFLNFIPMVGPILSTIAGAASGMLSGNYAGAVSSIAGGFASGGAFNRSRATQTISSHPMGSVARGAAGGVAFGGGKASGGPVRRGMSYIVGEHRREVFEPDQNGYVHPSVDAFARSRAGGSGDGDIWERLTAMLERQTRALENLESMKPGDVVTRGAHGLIDRMNRDHGLREKMGRRLFANHA